MFEDLKVEIKAMQKAAQAARDRADEEGATYIMGFHNGRVVAYQNVLSIIAQKEIEEKGWLE